MPKQTLNCCQPTRRPRNSAGAISAIYKREWRNGRLEHTLPSHRAEHGHHVLGRHIGQDVVDLLEHETAAGLEDGDLLPQSRLLPLLPSSFVVRLPESTSFRWWQEANARFAG